MKSSHFLPLFMIFILSTSHVFAQDQSDFEIAADELTHIEDGNKIIASGNVEIHYDDYILKANELTYLADSEQILSNDNVLITYKNGTEVQSDKIEISKNLYNIIAQNFKMMFPMGGEFRAERVKKEDDGPLRLKYASYTSCKLCYDEKGNEKPLIWQANANNITYDKSNNIIEYKSLWLEMFDVPFLYLPYFSHPSPDVKRKSGFLFPSFGSESDLGRYIEIPFFWALSDYSNLTISPKIATEHNPILSGSYLQNFKKGFLDLSGMITDNSEQGVRGQVKLSTAFDINDKWRTSIDIEHLSDDTVLKYYGLNDDERAWIESKATLEGFTRNSNLSFNLLSFQDLRADVDNDRVPDIIPYIEYNRTFNDLPYGTYFNMHANILDMERADDFNSTRRIATTFEYTKPYISPFGALFNFSAFAAANIYSIDDYEYEPGQTFSGNKGFIIPNLSMEIRYPFAKKQKASYQVIEPIVQVIAAPNSSISDKIPNEDSLDFEFKDSSVLQQNHFSGYDRYDIGSRINYGINWTTYGQETGKATFFIGQSFRFSDSYKYPINSGFDKNISDIVGSATINPSDKLFLDYRFRFDSNSLQAKQNEITLSAGTSKFKLHLDYLFLKSTTQEIQDLDDREEINMSINSNFYKNWNMGVFWERDLKENRNIEIGGNLYYDDECFQTGIEITRNFTQDRDYSDGLSVTFNIVFKGMSNMDSLYNFEGIND